MTIHILTLFPEMFSGPFQSSIIKHAQEKNIVSIRIINIREFATDRYGSVDDKPYGGGHGMIMRVDVLDRALTHVQSELKGKKFKSILLDPKGTVLNQTKTREFARYEALILVCGHYEGVDARVSQLVDESLSVGEFILTGGEIPAILVTDAVTRLLPGTLDIATTDNESFSQNSLEYPQYTRPNEYKGMAVPEVLLSGNHAKIEDWKKNNTAPTNKK